jgi:hypothetical protein
MSLLSHGLFVTMARHLQGGRNSPNLGLRECSPSPATEPPEFQRCRIERRFLSAVAGGDDSTASMLYGRVADFPGAQRTKRRSASFYVPLLHIPHFSSTSTAVDSQRMKTIVVSGRYPLLPHPLRPLRLVR